jgi:hypothetical protein
MWQHILDSIIKEPGPLSTPCWIWQGYTSKGCGRTYFEGRHQFVHRLAYRFWVEAFPENLWILHHCDNPLCCNPLHLYPGTAADNVRDMFERGDPFALRQGPGGTTGIFGEEQILQIRELGAKGQTYASIADRFGAVGQVIADIVTGRRYKKYGGPRTPAVKRVKASRFFGVTEGKANKWRAQLSVKGKLLGFGTFTSGIDAARAYNAAVIAHNLRRPLNDIPEIGAAPVGAPAIQQFERRF